MRPSLANTLPLLFLSCSSLFGQGNTITIAGTGFCGLSGDYGPATQAALCNPKGLTVDFAGRVYFIDADNWRIRKVEGGVITTVAGNGIRGTDGEFGPSQYASIGPVSHLALVSGRVWFGDRDAHRIRGFDLWGNSNVWEFGTGAAASAGDGLSAWEASYNQPSGIAPYGDGQNTGFFVADAADGLVRKLDAWTGIVSTVVGPGTGILGDGGAGTAASLVSPGGLAVFNNALFIADTGHNRIRKLDLTTGIITTVAGNGAAGYSGDSGPATSAQLSAPTDLVFDAAGNLYVADSGNFRVRKIDAAGTISTFAGNGFSAQGADNVPPTQTSFIGVNGLGWNPLSNGIAVADGSHRIRVADPYTASTTDLSLNANPALPGDSVTMTATVTPSAATGSVTFTISGLFISTQTVGPLPLSGGQASSSWTPPAAGTYSIKVDYGGDATYAPSTRTVAEVVQKANTATSVTSNLNPSDPGQNVTLTATVSPAAATGTVRWYGNYSGQGTQLLGTATLVSGSAQMVIGTLPSGVTVIWADYVGDSKYNASTSANLSQQVRTATTTVLTTVSPSSYGAPVYLGAVIWPFGVSGTVEYYDGATLLGSAPASGPDSLLVVNNLSVGTHTLTAKLLPIGNYTGSTSAPVQHVVNPQSSAVSLAASPTMLTLGGTVNLTASVTPAGATGNAKFYQGATLLGSVALAGGQASFPWTPAGAGGYSLTAVYDGNASYGSSTSSAVAVTVQKAATSTGLVSNQNPSVGGSAVTFTATVTPPAAGGTVSFVSTGASGNVTLGTVAVVGGTASLATSALPAGVSNVAAQYGGDSNYNASASSPVAQTVRAASTTTLTATPASSTFGQSVTLQAAVLPSNATGSVDFFLGATLLGTAPVSGGTAQLVTAALPAGTLSLTAAYGGDATNLPSTSAPKSFVVAKANTTTTLSANPTQSRLGDNVTFTATVAPGTATGSVQFSDGGTVLATVPVSNGTAVFNTTGLSVATHSISATYTGSSNYNSSQSAVLSYRVKR